MTVKNQDLKASFEDKGGLVSLAWSMVVFGMFYGHSSHVLDTLKHLIRKLGRGE